FSSRRRHTRFSRDWSSDVCSSDLTMAFARRHYGRAFERGILDPATVVLELLSDQREKDDTVGPYGKSLLYLVSRALEEVHKMPLLGLAVAWDGNGNGQDVFNRQDRKSTRLNS